MIVFLNGSFLPIEDAKISPLDRGFLFGDGIYEVTPSYAGKMIGFNLHMERLERSLDGIGISKDSLPDISWSNIANSLLAKNEPGDWGLYFHVSRGAEARRFHGFPKAATATVFCMLLNLEPPAAANTYDNKPGLTAISEQDSRWRRCNIKSTALLGNVLHFQSGFAAGVNETILYNSDNELTEASQSNVFIVKDGTVITPALDHQKLAGITRHITLSCLRQDGRIPVEERVVSRQEVIDADEVWITNSGRHIAPIVELDGQAIGSGKVGKVWQHTMALYQASMYDF